ncbi:1598_t:CDS:2 [Paraglomus occultum]|uniref:1598_t:CDS:1 n=1 Tax=Paraglomus occultum TaxID=144539 RepID=A0A9N8ZN32_9GLOM|nr:1598_t:CDS:2 [Paraglomus occultum]
MNSNAVLYTHPLDPGNDITRKNSFLNLYASCNDANTSNIDKDFKKYGLKGGPAIKLADESKILKAKPKRSFSSYCSLKEVLTKYGIDDNRITAIPQFTPITRLTENRVTLNSSEVSGGESHGRVDYAVKKIVDTTVEDIRRVTEGKQNQPQESAAARNRAVGSSRRRCRHY